jgi:photosystem II stability/assembly factor-like uncharacterized protein
MKRLISWVAIVLVGLTLPITAQQPLNDLLRDSFQYRNLGPFRVGGWVSEIAVPEAPAQAHLYTFYVGVRHGGVWKTTNNGTTFEPVFDSQAMPAVGALAVAPTNAEHVWVGTGDASCARSANWGDGVYKSTDAGKTWQNVGLKESHHIARIIVHPTNPNIVYVAAMGHLFSPNEERGVFKTTDGGKTWQRVLFVNDRTGAIDLVINRNDPNTLYAALYECMRDPWRIQDGGPGSAIYKSSDGGANWKKLENGLPGGTLGRIGIDLCQKNPNTAYAVVDNRNAKAGTEGRPSLIGGEVYRTDDGGTSWRKVSADKDDVSRKSGYAFNQIKVAPDNPNRAFITGSNMIETTDGGKTWAGLAGGFQSARPFRRAFGDFRTLWIDVQNPERMIAGSDGGVYISYDGGKTCDHLNNLPLGEVYALTVDLETPYNIYAGLQDHESWRGPSNGWSGSIGLEDWTTVGTGDGMYNQVDPTDSRWLFNTQEFGRHARLDQKTKERKVIAPTRAQGQPQKQEMLRFNWVAPLRLSPQDPKTLYAGAQVLFRSRDRGDSWEEISPDLTTNDVTKISPPGAAIQFCTITTIAESPAQAGVIWVGTDDGKVQVTKDAGKTWNDVTKAIAQAALAAQVHGTEDAWTARVFASHHQAGVAYVAKSRLRQDDFRPFLFKTTDFGATWTQITNGLPTRTINVVFEDQQNPDLLFVGNDAGVYVSLNGGKQWAALSGNMPVVPVHDLVVHPREGDLVVGTYGRGIWVTDITPLREMNQALAADAHFFAIKPKARRREGALGNYRLYGDRVVVTPNEQNGMNFAFYLKDAPTEKLTLTVTDATGKTVRTFEPTAKTGLNRVFWDLGEGGRGPAQGGEFRPGAGLRTVPTGVYTVTLQFGIKKFAQQARVLATN